MTKNVLLNSFLSFFYHRYNLFSGTRWMKSYKVTLNDRIMVSKFVSWTSVKILFDNWLPNIPNKRSGAALAFWCVSPCPCRVWFLGLWLLLLGLLEFCSLVVVATWVSRHSIVSPELPLSLESSPQAPASRQRGVACSHHVAGQSRRCGTPLEWGLRMDHPEKPGCSPFGVVWEGPGVFLASSGASCACFRFFAGDSWNSTFGSRTWPRLIASRSWNSTCCCCCFKRNRRSSSWASSSMWPMMGSSSGAGRFLGWA